MNLLKWQVKTARETFEGTVGDVTEEMLYKNPGGKALPLGSQYIHVICSEDAIINGMMQGKPPLFASAWKDKTGISEPMPAMDEKWSENNQTWAHAVKLSLPEFREYAKAVYAATDAYLETLTDADTEKEIDLGAWGKKTVYDLLSGFIIGHMYSLTGEISVLKGVSGAQGYPF